MDAQILAELQTLNATLTNFANTSLASGGNTEAADRQKTSDERAAAQRLAKVEGDRKKSMEEFARIYKDTSRTIADMSTASQITATAFQDALAGTDISDLDDKLVNTFRNALEGSNNSIVSAMGSTMEKFSDVMGLEMEIASRNAFIRLKTSFDEGSITMDQFRDQAKLAGIAADDLDTYLHQAATDFELLQQETLDLSNAMNTASEEMIRSNRTLGETAERSGGLLKGLGTIAMAAGKELYAAANAAAKFGAGFSLIESRLLGMTPEGLAELQGQHKQAIVATSVSFDEFNSLLGTNNAEMRLFAGSLEDVSKLNASLVTDLTQLGGSVAGQTTYMKEQQDRFKIWNRVFSMTTEDFAQFNSEMINSNDMQARLFKMDKSQYVAAQQRLMQTYEELKIQGLTNEEAKGVINTLNELNGTMDPKEMYKKSFQLEAYAGSVGAGEAGKRASELMRAGDTTSAEFIKAMEEVNAASAAQQGGSLQDKMVDYRQLDARGISDLVGPRSPFAKLVTRDGAEIKEPLDVVADKMTVLPEIAGDALKVADQTLAFLKSDMLQAVIGVGGGAMGGLLGGMATGAAGAAVATAGVAAMPVLLAGVAAAIGVGSLKELWDSGGETSTIHEALSSMSSKFDEWTGLDPYNFEPPEPVEIDTIKEDAAILNELKKISQNSQEAMIHGMSQTELMKIAQKINQENKDALIQQTDIIDAYESHKKNQSRKTQRGGNRRRE